MRRGAWIGLVALAGCDPSVGYSVEVTVTEATLLSLDAVDDLGVQVLAPDVGRLFPEVQPLDGTTDEQTFSIDGDAIVGREDDLCPQLTVSLVTVSTGAPLEPPIEVAPDGACAEGSTEFVGTAQL